MKVTAIVPAAGAGRRFGANKPFVLLRGKPLFLWALTALEEAPEISEIIPVFKDSDMGAGRELIERHSLSKVKRIAGGGPERQDSVANALKLISPETDIVLIHDGGRPLIETALISMAIAALADGPWGDGVITAVPPKDTVKEAAPDGVVLMTLDRRALWSVQTPQVFRRDIILRAYERASSEGFYSTDDSALVERYGGRVSILMGSYRNIKVTTPEDIAIAEVFLRESRGLSCG